MDTSFSLATPGTSYQLNRTDRSYQVQTSGFSSQYLTADRNHNRKVTPTEVPAPPDSRGFYHRWSFSFKTDLILYSSKS